MLNIICAFITILNISSTTLHNTIVVVGDDAYEVGNIDIGEHVDVYVEGKEVSVDGRQVTIENRDNIRVVFTLGQEREGWLGTDILPYGDVTIDDNTKTFEVDIDFEN